MCIVSKKKKISIVVCCYNEEDNIELMYNAISKEMRNLAKYDYEIVFEDNDSNDKSQIILRQIASRDKHVKVIFNQFNFGPDKSAVNCYSNASGDAIIGIPCDFQEPPEMIPQFIEEWEKGYDIVWGQKKRSKENVIKATCRTIFYGIIKKMSDYPQIEQITGFGLMDRRVIDIILITQKQDPYYHARNLTCEYGFKTQCIPYIQNKRERGKSSYNAASYFNFAVTSLVNTSVKPLRMMTIIGFFVSVTCFFVAIFYLIYKLANWYSFDAGMAPLVIGLFFVSGVQLFCMGMIGEYITVLIRRTTKKPIVVEKEKINFDKEEE